MQVNLVMFREPGGRKDFPMTDSTTTIGRKDECDIRIPLTEVSRRHARIAVVGDEAFLEDLGSANGTFLNNQRVETKAKLSPGDHIVVGPVVFTVQLDGEPQEIRAVKTKLRPLSAVGNASASSGDSKAGSQAYGRDEELDPISALEALASSADQTAIDAFDDEDGVF